MWLITFIIWFVLCLCIAGAASERGREGAAWFFLAFFLSPLIAVILLLAFPNLKHEQMLREMANASVRPPALPPPLPQGPFEPDGIYAGIPYRVTADAAVEAIIQGAIVRFKDFDRFTNAFKTDLSRE